MGRKIFNVKTIFRGATLFIKGWYYFLFSRSNPEAHRRLSICKPCEFRKGFLCGKCKCVLGPLARAGDNSLCDASKW